MRRLVAGVVALLVPMMLLTGPALAQKKKKGVDKDLDKNSEKMIKAGVVVGKISNVYEEGRKINLSVSIPKMQVNQGAITALQNAQIQMAQARAQRNYQAMISAQQALIQAQRQPLYTTTYEQKTIELTASDSVVVRMARPKEDFDEKGRIKKYTKKELAEMRGKDPKMPGYKGEWSDLRTDQVVQVSLVRKKGTPARPVIKAKKKGKGKAAVEDVDDLLGKDENAPQISMVYILREPAASK